MNYLEMSRLSLNEGLFKDLDKNIVSIDDPEYEQKVKDQTFKDFQDADRKNKKIKDVQDWLAKHVVADYDKLTPDLYTVYYDIVFKDDDTQFERPIINLFTPIAKYGSGVVFTVSITDAPYLPYKFGTCTSYSSFRLINQLITPMSSEILKNIPDYIDHCCFLDNLGLTDISGLPKGLTVVNTLSLSDNSITTLKGMPDNIKVGSLDLDHNKLRDLTGFNHTTKIRADFSLTYNEDLKTVRGLPDNYTLHDLNLDHCGITSLKDIGWPKNLHVTHAIDLSNNNLTFADFPEYPDMAFPKDLQAGRVDVKWQSDNAVASKGPEFKEKAKEMIERYPAPRGAGNIPGIPHGYTKNKEPLYKVAHPDSIKTFWGSQFVVPESTLKAQWKKEGILNLNEGLFKDLDKNIISVDDPEYEQKVKDQTFNDFQEHDRIIKTYADIRQWIHEHVYYIEKYKSEAHIITAEDEDVLYDIERNGNDFTINLTGATDKYRGGYRSMFCLHSLVGSTTDLFNEKGELPYKFGKCLGGFRIDYAGFNYREESKNVEELNYGLKSLKNFPYYIAYDCTLSMSEGSGQIIDLSESGLSGLPENFGVAGTFQIHYCNLKNFKGMPAGIQVENFLISFNPIVNLQGWHPNAKVGKLEIAYCTGFKSLFGLPDNYTFEGNLTVRNCELEDIIDWPKNLTIDGELSLINNRLTKATIQRLPGTINVYGFLSCYNQEPRDIYSSKKSPAVLPDGIMAVNGISYWIHRKDYKVRVANGMMGEISLNEGAFEEIDKNIVSIDDSDYEQKVKDQTFRDFQESDLRIKKEFAVIEKVQKWIAEHILFQGLEFTFEELTNTTPRDDFRQYSSRKESGVPSDFFSIEFKPDDVKFDHPIINLLQPSWTDNWDTLIFNVAFDDKGLPYKFGKCYGDFELNPYRSQGHQLTTLENIPDYVKGHCSLTNSVSGPGGNKSKPLVKIKDLSTLPKGFKCTDLYLQNAGLTSLNGMPDNINIYNLNLNNNHLTNFKGFNPTAVIDFIIVKNNPEFKSIEGLPDNYTLKSLNISENGIEDIVNWPKNLTVLGTINMQSNKITIDKFPEYPDSLFPKDLTVNMGIDLRYQKPQIDDPVYRRYGQMQGEWITADGQPKYIMPTGVTDIFGTYCVHKKEYFEAKRKNKERESKLVSESLKDRNNVLKARLKI